MMQLSEQELFALGYRRLRREDLVCGGGCYFIPQMLYDSMKEAQKVTIKTFTPEHLRYRIFREWKDENSIYVTHPNAPSVPHNTHYDIPWLLSGRYIIPCSIIVEGVEW